VAAPEDVHLCWFTIPYIPIVSEKLRKAITDLDKSYFSLNKLEYIIKGHKDALPMFCAKNVVYNISCNDCDAFYVGQISRQLKTRIKELLRPEDSTISSFQ